MCMSFCERQRRHLFEKFQLVIAYPRLACDRDANSPTCATAYRGPTPRSGSVVGVVTPGIETHHLVLRSGCVASRSQRRVASSTVGSVGTPGYMAPELFKPDAAGLVHFTTAVDTFAFGATCSAILLGKLPPAIRKAPPNLPSKTVSFSHAGFRLSADVVTMLDACLAVDPAARPPMNEVNRLLGLHLLRDRHRALITLRGKTYILEKSNRGVQLSVKDQGSITVRDCAFM
jgi:serine/threonine protein kinase